MSTEANKAVVRRWLEEFSVETIDELFIFSYRHHDGALPSDMQSSSEAYKDVVNMFRHGFPDFRITIEDMLAEGDKVAARWVFSGTTPRGKHFSALAISISRIENGKLAENWVSADFLSMLRQIGTLVPRQPEQSTSQG